MYDELDRWYGEERHAHADSSRNSFDFWGLTLSGSVSVGDIARFYGLNIPHSECGMTLAVYLKRMGNGGLHPGYRASVGKADFVVLETENGTARKIGLAMRPAREHKPWLQPCIGWTARLIAVLAGARSRGPLTGCDRRGERSARHL
jgi:hypothetical protein